MNTLKPLLCCFCLLFVISCKVSPSQKNISFYHWKTSVEINETSEEYLAQLSANKLYLRFFDLKWIEEQQSVYPVATVQPKNIPFSTVKEITPVIYIENAVFERTSEKQLDYLARQTLSKINRLYESYFKDKVTINEIQFDCDWTDSTRNKYFSFLKLVRSTDSYAELQFPALSCTVRLHQVKYWKRTGVPEVENATIMFYNVGKVSDMEETNSILNIETVKKYTEELKDYPILYNVALPLFSWGILFRNGEIVSLINDAKLKDLEKIKHRKEGNVYTFEEFGYVGNSFVYEGDQIRYEEITEDLLAELSQLISKRSARRNPDYILYHLNAAAIDRFPAEILKNSIQ